MLPLLSPNSLPLQPHGNPKASVEFAPPVAPVSRLICPQFCECAGSPLTGTATRVVSASVVNREMTYLAVGASPGRTLGVFTMWLFEYERQLRPPRQLRMCGVESPTSRTG